MLSRIRYFFVDLGHRVTDPLRFRGQGAGAEPAETPVEAPETPAEGSTQPSPAGRGRWRRPGAERRRIRRQRKAAAEAEAVVAAAAAAPQAAVKPEASASTEAAATAELPATPKRRFLRRPSLRRPSLPRPRVPRPSMRRPGRRGLIAGGIVLLLAAAVAGVYLATDFDFGEGDEPAPAPRVVIEEEAAPQEAPELGFPAFATKNTTRVAGENPIADAAGVALATSPATGGVEGPPAVSLVPEDDWPASVAAAALVADPVGAPILISTRDEVPDLTLTALTALAPQGSSRTGDTQLFRVGNAVAPRGLRLRDLLGDNPAELGVAIADLRERLTGRSPEHVLLVSSDRPEFAMPAAAWAARSGDPVLFVQQDSVPAPTLEALRDLGDVPLYLLGPESVVSDQVIDRIAKETDNPPKRVGDEDPVSNAIAFARYADGTFGWNITDPGHGTVIANTSRPTDAGAAAALSASGKWGPLLVTESADALPAALEGFLLDIKPGYIDDPTRAVYNHAWLIGDDAALSVDVQAQIDELLELTEVESGRGQTDFGALPGQAQPESQPDTGSGGNDQ